MTKLTSRERDLLSTSIKVGESNNCNYAPAEMTDKSVHQLAQHSFTISEIAEFFSVAPDTVIAHHGEVFKKGRMIPTMKRRVLYDQMTTAMLNVSEEEWQNPKIAGSLGPLACKLMEMGWKKSEGYGEKSEVTVTHKQVNASDFKFLPLTIDNKDEPWTE